MSGSEQSATGVTAARGFLAAGVACAIRKKDRLDLALVVSDRPASAACMFTTNQVQAAPIVLSRANLLASQGTARAVVINAGNANACTGEAGLEVARHTAREVATRLGIAPEQVIVGSTGVIGQQLPVERLVSGLDPAVAALSATGGEEAARAIMTTDLTRKESVRHVETSSGRFTVGGMAKGSGMIHPDMATTLAVVTTDAAVEPALLHRILKDATDRSFHRITVDGDTSTNDMIALLANGASRVAVDESSAAELAAALEGVLLELALAIARDGEGATKLIAVRVTGALSEADALRVSKTIASSPLVKTAIAGEDANWGRIVAAVGRSGVAIRPELLRVSINDVEVLAPGYVSSFSEEDAARELATDTITLDVDLGLGSSGVTTWTCDLTHGYIDINGSYRT